MIRYGTSPIIFLINNGGYTIEVEIHDGPYNKIKNWDYAGLVDIFNAGEGNGWGCRVTTEGELDAAIAEATGRDGGAAHARARARGHVAAHESSVLITGWGELV